MILHARPRQRTRATPLGRRLGRALGRWGRRGHRDGSVGVERFGNDIAHPLEEEREGVVKVRGVGHGLGTLAGQNKVLGDGKVAERLIENVAADAVVDYLEERGSTVLHLGVPSVVGQAYPEEEGAEAAHQLVLLGGRVVGDLGREERHVCRVVQELRDGRAALDQPGAQEDEEPHPTLHLEVGALGEDVGALLEEGDLTFALHGELDAQQLQLLACVEGVGEGDGRAPIGEGVLPEETRAQDVTRGNGGLGGGGQQGIDNLGLHDIVLVDEGLEAVEGCKPEGHRLLLRDHGHQDGQHGLAGRVGGGLCGAKVGLVGLVAANPFGHRVYGLDEDLDGDAPREHEVAEVLEEAALVECLLAGDGVLVWIGWGHKRPYEHEGTAHVGDLLRRPGYVQRVLECKER